MIWTLNNLARRRRSELLLERPGSPGPLGPVASTDLGCYFSWDCQRAQALGESSPGQTDSPGQRTETLRLDEAFYGPCTALLYLPAASERSKKNAGPPYNLELST